MLYCGVIRTRDGNHGHAITIFQNWIFDSNEERAFPFVADGLDLSSGHIPQERDSDRFANFERGILLIDTTKKQKLLKRFKSNHFQQHEKQTNKLNESQ